MCSSDSDKSVLIRISLDNHLAVARDVGHRNIACWLAVGINKCKSDWGAEVRAGAVINRYPCHPVPNRDALRQSVVYLPGNGASGVRGPQEPSGVRWLLAYGEPCESNIVVAVFEEQVGPAVIITLARVGYVAVLRPV